MLPVRRRAYAVASASLFAVVYALLGLFLSTGREMLNYLVVLWMS